MGAAESADEANPFMLRSATAGSLDWAGASGKPSTTAPSEIPTLNERRKFFHESKNSPLIKYVRIPSRAEELQKSAFHNLPFFHSLCVFSCTMIASIDFWPPPAAFFFANPPDSTGKKMRERVQISACFLTVFIFSNQ